MQVSRVDRKILDQYLASSRVVNAETVKCYTVYTQLQWTVAWQVSDTHRWFCLRETVDEVFMTRRLDVTRRQHNTI